VSFFKGAPGVSDCRVVAKSADAKGLSRLLVPPAIDTADLQARQLGVPKDGNRAMERRVSRIDELRHFFLAEDCG